MLGAVLLAVAAVVYNAATNLRWPLGRWYVPVHVVASAVAMGGAIAAGLDPVALGIGGPTVWDGLRIGSAAATAVALAMAIAGALGSDAPILGPLLLDRRVAGLTDRQIAVEVFARIPLGTGGIVFARLRLVSGSLLAPMLTHWATNGPGLLTAAFTQQTPDLRG